MGNRERPHGPAWFATSVVVGIVLAACSTLSRNGEPETASLDEVRAAPGRVRIWGDVAPRGMEAIGRQRDTERRAAGVNPSGVMNYLAVSGGGSDGAFGAGLLVGWSEAGTRPRFDVVTGISTGALIAPFAFLGPAYDTQLKGIYTNYGSGDIARKRNLFGIVANASVADSAPLADLIEFYVTPEFMQ